MPDETIDLSRPIKSRESGPLPRVKSSPTVADDITDPGLATAACESAPPADDLPNTVRATGAVDPGKSNGMDATGFIDATARQQMDATAVFDRNPQGGSARAGAFDPTEGATGAYDPTDPGGKDAGLAEDELVTQDMSGAEQRKGAGPALSGPRCGNYVLKKFYAKGGMGEVWLAEDPVIGRSVALKRMLGKRSDQQMRFRVEAQITGQLEHPGIVPVHELGTNAKGEPYYVMKFVQGHTLQKVIQEFHAKQLTGGAREVEQLRLLQMFLSVCQTVGYAHSRGVLHRDLKPDNVMLGPFGETILLDWGIAKVLGQDNPAVRDESGPSARLRRSIPDTGTQDGAIMGTPTYMAPEVAAGLNEEVDERSDIYLLGATLYQILSGCQPRTAKTMAEIIKKAKEEPPKSVRSINPLVPKALEAICLKAMAHAKTDRYQTATELAEEIQRFVAGEPVSAYREGFPARAWRWAKRNRKALVRSAVAVLIGSTALFAAIKVRDAEHRRAEATREANRLKAQERARGDLKKFRHLADEANFFAATTNPASEHAPYFDPHKGAAMLRVALELAKSWGTALEALPLPEERAAVKSELHGLLILAASETLRSEPGHAGAWQALATLDQAVRMGGSSVSDIRLRAGAYEQLGDEKQAAEMRRRAEDPKTPRTSLDLFLLGERERDESAARVGDQTDLKPWQLDPARMQRAVALYRQALAIDPDHYWARLQLGRCLQSLGRFPEAAEALGACIAIRPEAPWGYSALGLALAEQGRYDEAEHELNQAIGIDADARPPRLHRGVVYWRQKKYDEAVADFEAVLAPPDDKRLVEAAYYRGQLHLERGEVQKALDDFDRVVVASPGFRSVYLDRPLIYLSRRDAPRALADLDTYVSLVRKIDPGGWEVHGLRGRLLRFLFSELPQEKRREPTGRMMLELALAELFKAVQMGGNNAGLFDDLGAVLEHAGRLDQAIVAYSKGITAAPDLAKLRIKRGWAWEQLNQHDKASADFAAAARVAPENAEAHTGLGYVQALRKLPRDAQREADLSLLHGSDEYLVLHNVACIYAALSQTDSAQASAYQDVSIALLRQALKLWKKSATGPNELDLIKAEPAFKPIQGRKDFQELLRSASNAGGGSLNLRSTTTLTNCTVSGNSARNAGGGLVKEYGTSTLTDCTLSGNSAGGSGGGLANSQGSTTVTGTNVQSNSAVAGGGLFNQSTLNVSSSKISNNQAKGSAGGAILSNGGSLALFNSLLAGNAAIGGAGASGQAGGDGIGDDVALEGNATATITNTVLKGNVALGGAGGAGAGGGDGIGGGIAVAIGSIFGTSDTSSVSFSDSSLTGNQSGQATPLPGTDPSGAGTDNWEVEEALDVEWTHAMAPGAQIVLVEANSQSLPDLMASVATAASQPGVSVVSMSWGFAEGQQVFAADEATYDSYFKVPGVTFVASTGDYGAADPEYPAYSPNVVSVGGTSLTLNGNNSYNSETGWGYQSASVGAFIGSGGGLSLYEPEPAFQEGVQSTGMRTTPDVSLVADPATGAWIADPYNLDPSNPFEVVGGTSLSAPAWAGLLALVNQGSAAAGGRALNSSSATETQQALYSLPQNDYNAITSGTNGYTAGAGYNLLTGLGTPVANLLVSDLVAYQSGTFVASGPAVGPLQNANLVNTGAASSGTTDVFAVFDSLLDMGNGLGLGHDAVANLAMTTTPAAAGQAPSTGFLVQGGHGAGLGAATNPGRFGVMPNSPNEVTVIPVTTGLLSRQLAGPIKRPGVTTATKSEHFAFLPRTEPSSALGVVPTRHEAGRLANSVLEELARDSILARGQTTSGATGLPRFWFAGTTDTQPGQVESRPAVLGFGPVSSDDLRAAVPADQPAGFTARLAAILLAVGYWRHGARIGTSRKRGAGSPAAKRSVVQGQKRDLAPFQA